MLSFVRLLICFVLFCFSSPALARQDLVEFYLLKINNLVASFSQFSSGKNIASVSGHLYVSQPYVKWVYDYPEGTLELIYNGSKLSYYDKDLGEVNNFFLKGGFYSIFSNFNDFKKSLRYLKIKDIEHNVVKIDGEDTDSGVSFSLYLKKDPVIPLKMRIARAGEETKYISFFDVKSIKIPSDEFIISKDINHSGDF